MERLNDIINELPPDLKKEVEDFVEFLVEKKLSKKEKKLQLNWAGALSEYKGKYNSIDLQKEAMKWREN